MTQGVLGSAHSLPFSLRWGFSGYASEALGPSRLCYVAIGYKSCLGVFGMLVVMVVGSTSG